MKTFYAGYSRMGVNFTYDSPCWSLFGFATKAARDKYVDENYYDADSGNIVMEAVSRKDAEKILGRSLDSQGIHREPIDETRWEIETE